VGLVSREKKNVVVRSLETGFKDLPRNTSWLLSKALGPVANAPGRAAAAADGAAGNVAETARTATSKVTSVLPGGGGSVEQRVEQAHAAAERARAAEEKALQAAEAAKARSDALKAMTEESAAQVEEFKKEQAARTDERTAEARRQADEQVAEARREAEEEARRRVDERVAEAESQLQKAREQAEAAQEHATAELATATQLLDEARRLSDEAEQAAQSMVDEAHRQAARVGGIHQTDAKRQVAEAEKKTAASATKARKVSSAVPNQRGSQGAYKTRTKSELLELAASKGIKGRSSMNKAQLVRALSHTR
jgi:hypothetical protein